MGIVKFGSMKRVKSVSIEEATKKGMFGVEYERKLPDGSPDVKSPGTPVGAYIDDGFTIAKDKAGWLVKEIWPLGFYVNADADDNNAWSAEQAAAFTIQDFDDAVKQARDAIVAGKLGIDELFANQNNGAYLRVSSKNNVKPENTAAKTIERINAGWAAEMQDGKPGAFTAAAIEVMKLSSLPGKDGTKRKNQYLKTWAEANPAR